GTIPPELKQELLALADKAAEAGKLDLADDLRLTVKHILQCSSNQAFQGVFKRLVQAGLLTPEKHKSFEKELAAHTCHIHGGICAFNGTGNSCRHAVSAFGLVHPELELLTEPPRYEQVDAAVQSMLAVCNDSQYSVSHIVKQNKENAIRVHAATGGSTNLMMHLVSAIIYAGERFSIHDYEKVRTNTQVPDMLNYSLTEGRDIFVLAEQRQRGTHAGMATVLYELKNQGIPVNEDAPTMAGCSWGERLKQDERLSAANERDNPILLSTPKRPAGGIDVLAGNFFESAVVKISGMTEPQFHHFDNKIALVLYFENEEEAVAHLLDENILSKVCRESGVTQKTLLHMYTHNTGKDVDDLQGIADVQTMFTRLVETEALRIAVLIAGQGPEAFGMPEMFTPTQHLNHNRTLKKICAILSDGRFSGVSYGAVIGHMTPEAYREGGILYLQSGDVLHLRLTQRELLLLDKNAFEGGTIQPYAGDLAAERRALGKERLRTMQSRRRKICPANQMGALTDAAHGVVPNAVWAWAE
ncbi:dihydroxy-acid dehydratase, partial [bacterium]|nr:dihydroxy-acid dehydratase [bacterium]